MKGLSHTQITAKVSGALFIFIGINLLKRFKMDNSYTVTLHFESLFHGSYCIFLNVTVFFLLVFSVGLCKRNVLTVFLMLKQVNFIAFSKGQGYSYK